MLSPRQQWNSEPIQREVPVSGRGKRPNSALHGSPAGTIVLLVGDDWGPISLALESLQRAGRYRFLRPGQPVEASGAPVLLLVGPGPDPGQGARQPSSKGLPLLLCVRDGALEDEDLYPSADDFIRVPCSAAELAKRMARLLARSARPEPSSNSVLRTGKIELNLPTYEARVDGTSITLAWMEFQLLRFLMEHSGRVFRREEILRNVWGADYIGGMRTVDVHMRRLRHKLGAEGERWLRTVRNVGYGFERDAVLS